MTISYQDLMSAITSLSEAGEPIKEKGQSVPEEWLKSQDIDPEDFELLQFQLAAIALRVGPRGVPALWSAGFQLGYTIASNRGMPNAS